MTDLSHIRCRNCRKYVTFTCVVVLPDNSTTATLILSLSHSDSVRLAKSLIVVNLSLDVVCGALACPTCCILCVTNCWTFLSAEEGLRKNAVRSFCSSKCKSPRVVSFGIGLFGISIFYLQFPTYRM